MSDIAERVEKARKAGYSDAEIAGALAESGSELAPKIKQAKEAGYADADIVSHLAQAKEQKPRGMVAELGRQVALTGRAAVQGVTAIPEMLTRGALSLYDMGAGAIESATGIPQTRYGQQQLSVSDALTRAGVPAPQNATERVAGDVAGAMAGQGGMVSLANVAAKGVGPELAQRIANVMKPQPGLQIASAGTGAAGAGIARESGAGPMGQLAAGIGGAMVPSAATSLAPMTLRAIARGGEPGRQRMADNIRTFEDSGYGTPTVGQASENRAMRATESVLSKTPGGAGRMAATAEQGAKNLGASVDDLADDLSVNASGTKAGARIESGIKTFVDEFKTSQGNLYGKLDARMPKDTRVDMTNTLNKLSELNSDIPGAPELSKFFKNSTIQGIEGAIKSDTKDFTQRLPYEALKKLRTLVGQELENTTLTSSVPRSKWQALYASISKDLSEAAREAGPEAQAAFKRANDYTRAGHERIGVFLDRVVGKDTPEKIFQAAVNPSEIKEGASTINAVMRSLPKDDRAAVQAAFLKRLGVATPGKQNELGEVFSPETFLTNWNKISPEAKRVLFADGSGQLRSDLDTVARVAANLREGSRVFSNLSGTQPALSAQAAGGGAMIALATGHPAVAAAIGATAVSANAMARLMANPKFVHWLAKSTDNPSGAILGLQGIAQSMSGEDRKAAEEFMKAARQLPK